MSFTELLEPILNGGIRSVNFYNGRLLSAEDLKQEQEANREGRARLGQAVGPGVAFGLDVAPSAANTPGTPVVTVSAGLAVSREGRALKLSAPVDLALVQQPPDDDAPAGSTFKDCRQTRGGVYVSGAGVYLLTISPAEGAEGRAPFSGLGNTVVTCNTRYRVEGVQFRLLRLLNSTQLGTNPATLRSRVAYDCLGAAAFQKFGRQPLDPPPTGYGLLDALRPAPLTDAEVPLAVVYWSANGIGFVDGWSVRRPLSAGVGSERFAPLAGGRRRGEALAALFHFQDHLAAIRKDALIADTASLKADDHFAFLPPAGLLPRGTNEARGFDWRKFLGPHAPAGETHIDEGLLRSIIDRSLLLDPVKLSPFAAGSQYSAAPPEPFAVYLVPGAADFALFARSARGRVRVFIDPPDTLVRAGQIYADDGERGNQRFHAHVVERSGIYPFDKLDAGSYRVGVHAPGVFVSVKLNVAVVEGRTTDVSFAITTPGSLVLTVKRATDETSIGRQVQSVTLTPAGGGAPLLGKKSHEDDTWLVNDVPPGTYTVSVTAGGYVPGELTGVKITVAEVTAETIKLNPVPVTTGFIQMEIWDTLSQERIDWDVTAITATNTQTNATTAAGKDDQGVWKFTSIPVGTYDIAVEATHYKPGKVEGVVVAPSDVKTVIALLEPLPGKIVLGVTDKNTGEAIDDLVTSVTAISHDQTVKRSGTKAGNAWSVEVPPGVYEVLLRAPNYSNATVRGVSVLAGTDKPQGVQMEPTSGTISLTLTWPNYKVGNFEAVIKPADKPAHAPVAFDAAHKAVIGGVAAGIVRVTIRETTAGGVYPDTIFHVKLPPGGTLTQTVALPALSIHHRLSGSSKLGKPRTDITWYVDPGVVEPSPSAPFGGMQSTVPGRADVRSWLAAWRDWLVLTRPDLRLQPPALPQVVTITDWQAVDGMEETGRVFFYRSDGSKAAMKLNISTIWDVGL